MVGLLQQRLWRGEGGRVCSTTHRHNQLSGSASGSVTGSVTGSASGSLTLTAHVRVPSVGGWSGAVRRAGEGLHICTAGPEAQQQPGVTPQPHPNQSHSQKLL